LTEEQKMLKDMVRRFADEQIKPKAKEIDEKCEIPQEIIKQLAELGLFGVFVSEQYGGQGLPQEAKHGLLHTSPQGAW